MSKLTGFDTLTALVVKAKKGEINKFKLLEHEAIDRIKRKYQYNYHNNTGQVYDLEDIGAEVKLIIIELFDKFEILNEEDAGQMFYAFLDSGIYYRLVDNFKKYSYYDEYSGQNLKELSLDSFPDDLENTFGLIDKDSEERSCLLMMLFNKLESYSDRKQEIITRRIFEDRTYRSIADEMNLTKQYVHRIFCEFQEEFKKEYFKQAEG